MPSRSPDEFCNNAHVAKSFTRGLVVPARKGMLLSKLGPPILGQTRGIESPLAKRGKWVRIGCRMGQNFGDF